MRERLRLLETIKLRDQMFDLSDMPSLSSLAEGADPERKDRVITCLLKTIKKNQTSPVLSEQMLDLIATLRTGGIDYPEFEAIEKSFRTLDKTLSGRG